MSIDCEVSLKSLLFVTESLEQLIGEHGARAVLRTAGQRAAANLIEMLPLTLPGNEAIRRSGAILAELGFIEEMKIPAIDTLHVFGNHVIDEFGKLGLESVQSGSYYVVGLFEGFCRQMSASQKKVTAIEQGQNFEIWRLA